MNWEREDRIFEFAWKPGDWQTLAQRYAQACERVPPLARQAARLAATVKHQDDLDHIRDTCYLRSRSLEASLDRARTMDFAAPRAALEDLTVEYPGAYPAGNLTQLASLQQAVEMALQDHQPDQLDSWTAVAEAVARFEGFRRSALLANPLLDFESLLVLKRVPLGGARRTSWEGYGHGEYLGIPRQSSWNYGTMPNVENWTNEIAVLSLRQADGQLTTLYQPPGTRLVNDIELHWDADRLLFSMPDANRNWQVHELALDPVTGVARLPSRQLTPASQPDVHNYDAIYLPSDEIIFLSTAPLQGVPCNAGVIVGMMYKMSPDGKAIRQLTFEQDHDYTPSVLNDGRVLYLRWDYTDTPHVWNRLLMAMNPDGTAQMEYTGANSYWPNAMFFARLCQIIRRRSPPSSPATTRGGSANCFCSIRPEGAAKPRGLYSGSAQRTTRDAEDRGQTHRAQLAQVPASLAALTEIFPGRLQAQSGCVVGHLPGGCVRQHGAAEGRRGSGAASSQYRFVRGLAHR